MTEKEMLAIRKKYLPISNGVSTAYTEDEVKKLAADPVFQDRKKRAQEYMKHIDALDTIIAGNASSKGVTTAMSRFTKHYLREEKTPEDVEYNRDFLDMQYTNAGQQILGDKIINTVMNADLGISYPADAGEALDKVTANPSAAEQMWTISMFMDSQHPFDLHPLIKEHLKYNKLAMETGSYASDMVKYYANDTSCVFKEGGTFDDADKVTDNAKRNSENPKVEERLSDSERGAASDFVCGQAVRTVDATPEWKAAVADLKQRGIIGPDFMFYRAFDDDRNRLTLDDAIKRHAKGERITFIPMTPEERKELKELMAKPTTVHKQADPGPLAGKDFINECADLYKEIAGVDSMFVRSSKEFAQLKQGLKDIAESKTYPNSDQVKQTLRQLVGLTSTYRAAKGELMNQKVPMSQTAKDRYAVVDKIHKALAPKLGALALRDYKIRTATREMAEKNREAFNKTLDDREAARIAAHKPQNFVASRTDNIQLPGQDMNTSFGRLGILASNAIRAIRSNLQPGAPLDPEVNNGHYLAVMMAYNLVMNEREKNGFNGEPGPLEQSLAKHGAKAFCRGVMKSTPIHSRALTGITAQKLHDAARTNAGKQLLAELKEPKVQKQILEEVEKYAAAHPRKAVENPVKAAPAKGGLVK